MSATAPQVGGFTFLDGQGPPQKQCYGSTVVQNPGGGGIAAVLVPGRAPPYSAILRGTFVAVPDFRSLIGSVISYIKDGITVEAYVDRAGIAEGHWVKDTGSNTALFLAVGQFSLVPLA